MIKKLRQLFAEDPRRTDNPTVPDSRLRREVISQPTVTNARSLLGGQLFVPETVAVALRRADSGHDNSAITLYRRMDKCDAHLGAVKGTRINAASSSRWELRGGDQRFIDAGTRMLNTISMFDSRGRPTLGFADLIESIHDAIEVGYSVHEIIWDTSNVEEWKPRVRFVDQRHFEWDRNAGQLLLDNEPLDPFKWIYHEPSVAGRMPWEGGLGRTCLALSVLKNLAIQDWSSFVELFGMPLRLGKYGPEMEEDQRQVLFDALVNMGSDAAAIVPLSADIEFVQPQKSGEAPFKHFANWVDQQISKLWLGGTMLTDDGSSRSQAEVMERNFDEYIKGKDARALAITINRDLLFPYYQLNFGLSAEEMPQFEVILDEGQDTDQWILNATNLFKNSNYTIPKHVIDERLGLGSNDLDETLIGGPQGMGQTEEPVDADSEI